jgi:RalA-binding protein 1
LSDTNATDGASAATAAAAAALEEEAKKARACEACRGLKVRCEPDPDDETKPCKRCKKAGRNCVVTAPSRKRQKKTDSRVADLEKKIDALTATLQARSGGSNAQQLSGPGHGRDSDIIEDDAPTRSTAPAWGGVPSARTWHASTMASSQDRERHSPSGVPRRTTSMGTTPPSTRAGQKRKDRESIGSPEQLSERTRQAHSHYPSMSYKSRNPDFLERGLITMEQAEQLLRRYIDQMVPHFPAILVTPGTTAAELNKTRPMLFSSIMAAATSYQPVLQRTLQKELMTCFAEKVFLAGEKSLDTVQAILVAVIWYWPPENFEELKFYQLIHTASVMAIDIGLGRRNGSRRTEPPFGLRDPVSKKPPPPDALTLECRRTWLACYLLGTNAAMALHRPVLIRWSLFMEESAELLEKSPDALPSDKSLAQLVWAHKLSEDTGIHFFSEDPEKRISLSDPSIRFLLKGLERELENKRASVPVEKQPREFLAP